MTVFDPATRPAEPAADAKRRLAEAVEAARAEIIALDHAIHEHPEPAYEEHQAAAWVAEAIARHGFTVELPAGSLATAVRGRLRGAWAATGRGSGSSRSTTRCPAWVTAAVTT